MRVRFYKPSWVNRWLTYDENGKPIVAQYELAYKVIDTETLQIVETGTEDFSPERVGRELSNRWIYTWDGKRRNKGGYRAFDDRGMAMYRRSEVEGVKEYYRNRYQAAEVQLRS